MVKCAPSVKHYVTLKNVGNIRVFFVTQNIISFGEQKFAFIFQSCQDNVLQTIFGLNVVVSSISVFEQFLDACSEFNRIAQI